MKIQKEVIFIVTVFIGIIFICGLSGYFLFRKTTKEEPTLKNDKISTTKKRSIDKTENESTKKEVNDEKSNPYGENHNSFNKETILQQDISNPLAKQGLFHAERVSIPDASSHDSEPELQSPRMVPDHSSVDSPRNTIQTPQKYQSHSPKVSGKSLQLSHEPLSHLPSNSPHVTNRPILPLLPLHPQTASEAPHLPSNPSHLLQCPPRLPQYKSSLRYVPLHTRQTLHQHSTSQSHTPSNIPLHSAQLTHSSHLPTFTKHSSPEMPQSLLSDISLDTPSDLPPNPHTSL
ncbi:hypothetical protein CWI37_1721p0010, partial [Hamiltosporidium tvaerminnensis]